MAKGFGLYGARKRSVFTGAVVPIIFYLQWIGSDLAWVVFFLALLVLASGGASDISSAP